MLFDQQIFAISRRGGIARYFTELLREFRHDPDLDVHSVTPFRYVVNNHLLQFDANSFRRPPLPKFAHRRPILKLLDARRAAAARADIVHHTYFFADGLRLPAKRRVCTVYDMIPEIMPEQFPSGYPHLAKAAYVAACDAIICISETTRRDMLRIYGDLDKPVAVTPLAVGEQFFVTRECDAASYVLFVGERRGYKNFDVVIRALAQVKGLSLLCVGGGPFNPSEMSTLEVLGLSERVTQRSLEDHELPNCYASALCLVVPSLYEGFGLPVLEAFAAGTAAVVADTPGLAEVASDAAQYFKPDDPNALAGIINRLAEDRASRRDWIQKGHRRARDFSWKQTARLTSDVYRNLLAD